MMFTCYLCKVRTDSFADMIAHREEAHPLDYVRGVPFWMLEVKVPKQDYYWIARQVRDAEWLNAHK